jgi:hypothetical protein
MVSLLQCGLDVVGFGQSGAKLWNAIATTSRKFCELREDYGCWEMTGRRNGIGVITRAVKLCDDFFKTAKGLITPKTRKTTEATGRTTNRPPQQHQDQHSITFMLLLFTPAPRAIAVHLV